MDYIHLLHSALKTMNGLTASSVQEFQQRQFPVMPISGDWHPLNSPEWISAKH